MDWANVPNRELLSMALSATGAALAEIQQEKAKRGLGAADLPPDRSGQLSAAVPALPVLLEDIAILTGILEKVPWRDVYGLLPTAFGDAVDLLTWIDHAQQYAEAHAAGKGMTRMAQVLADVYREMPANESTAGEQTLADLDQVIVEQLVWHGGTPAEEQAQALQTLSSAPRPVRAVLLDFCMRVLTHGSPAWEGGPPTPAPYRIGAVAECLPRPMLLRRLAAVCGVRLPNPPQEDALEDNEDEEDRDEQ